MAWSDTEFLKKARNLRLNQEGIWQSSPSGELSYPKDGNEEYFRLEETSFWFRHRNNCIAEVFRRFNPAGPILDVGGGNGYVTRRLLDEGREAILLEPGTTGALNGKMRRQIPLVMCATLQHADFEPASVPAIGLFDVLEHIEDDQAFLRDLHTVLQPGGFLCLTVPAYSWLWSQSDEEAGHFRRYRLTDLERLLRPLFTVEYSSYFFSALVLPVLLLRAFPWRLGFSGKSLVLSDVRGHGTDSSLATRIVTSLLDGETRRIQQGKTIPTGTSCLVVARKKDSGR